MNRPRDIDIFKHRVGSLAERLRVQPTQVRVQRMTRKWASCSPDGRCTFAADLLSEGRAFQDYVIIHELLHLKVRNHGRLFKSLLAAHLPTWRRFYLNGLGTSCVARKEEA